MTTRQLNQIKNLILIAEVAIKEFRDQDAEWIRVEIERSRKMFKLPLHPEGLPLVTVLSPGFKRTEDLEDGVFPLI